MVNIKGLDKAELLVELYNHSHQQGMGMLQPKRDLSYEEAKQLLEKTTYFDYLYGKVLKVDLSKDELEEWLYDRDNGQGMVQSIVDKIMVKKKENISESSSILNEEKTEEVETIVNNDNLIDMSNNPNIIDLNNAYIGLYYGDKGYRVGLFKKSDKVQAKHFEDVNGVAQYYKDTLSDAQVALWLKDDGEDYKADFSNPLLNDSEEMKNWRANRETVGTYHIDMYKLPQITGKVDRHISLVEFTSVYPELQGNITLEQIVRCLAEFCSKFDLKPTAKEEIMTGLKEIPQYIAKSVSQGSSVPQFINPYVNEIDINSIPEEIIHNKRI